MSRKGFTLIEVIVAIAIMAIIFGALLSNLVSIIRGDRIAYGRTQAVHFAENLLELYRLRWQNPNDYALATPPRSSDISNIARHLPQSASYVINVERLDIDGNPWTEPTAPPMQKVEARVLDGKGDEIARATLFIPNPDLSNALR